MELKKKLQKVLDTSVQKDIITKRQQHMKRGRPKKPKKMGRPKKHVPKKRFKMENFYDYTISHSSSSTFVDCPRKWFFYKVLGIKAEQSDAAALGVEVHDILEKYLRDGVELPDTKAGEIARAGETFLPESDSLVIEQSIGDWGVSVSGLRVTGFVDMMELREGALWIGDHKTTSNIKYAKSADELAQNPQLLLYAYCLGEKYPEARRYSLDFTHIYYRTKLFPLSVRTDAKGSWEDVDFYMKYLEDVAEAMKDLASNVTDKTLTKDIPGVRKSCSKYGGCSYKKDCPRTGKVNENPFVKEFDLTKQTDFSKLLLQQEPDMFLPHDAKTATTKKTYEEVQNEMQIRVERFAKMKDFEPSLKMLGDILERVSDGEYTQKDLPKVLEDMGLEFVDGIIVPALIKPDLGDEPVEAPVVEAPVVEAPVVEAPVVEAPVVEETPAPKPKTRRKRKTTPKAAPVVETPAVETPVEPVQEAKELPLEGAKLLEEFTKRFQAMLVDMLPQQKAVAPSDEKVVMYLGTLPDDHAPQRIDLVLKPITDAVEKANKIACYTLPKYGEAKKLVISAVIREVNKRGLREVFGESFFMPQDHPLEKMLTPWLCRTGKIQIVRSVQ